MSATVLPGERPSQAPIMEHAARRPGQGTTIKQHIGGARDGALRNRPT